MFDHICFLLIDFSSYKFFIIYEPIDSFLLKIQICSHCRIVICFGLILFFLNFAYLTMENQSFYLRIWINWHRMRFHFFWIVSYFILPFDCAFGSTKLTDICYNLVGFKLFVFQLNPSAYASESESNLSKFYTISRYVILLHYFWMIFTFHSNIFHALFN
jgi:hypothetical protein